MSVQDLVDIGNLVPVDAEYDWFGAARRLRTELPEDYRSLVDAGGGGLWFGYVRVLVPDERLVGRNLLDADGVFRDLLVQWGDDPECRPFDLPADSSARLVAWANTEHGERVFWRVDPGVAPSRFPVYVEDADGERWERFDLSSTDFLLALARGELRSELLSTAALDPGRGFSPFRY